MVALGACGCSVFTSAPAEGEDGRRAGCFKDAARVSGGNKVVLLWFLW